VRRLLYVWAPNDRLQRSARSGGGPVPPVGSRAPAEPGVRRTGRGEGLMKLLFLHGPPTSGKRTVAEAVIHLTGGRLFDNHAAVDFARTVLDFDGPGFWDLVHSARLVALEKAARYGAGLVVHTSCYSHPDDLPRVEDFERVLDRHGGLLLPVFLSCSRATLEERVGSADRVARRKVASKDGLDRCLSRWNLVRLPRANCLTVDTDSAKPSDAARMIVAHFDLGSPVT
jgi:hypothetical protein